MTRDHDIRLRLPIATGAPTVRIRTLVSAVPLIAEAG